MNGMRGVWRHYGVALRAMVVATLVLGVGYTAVLTGIGQLAFPTQANGSLIERQGGTVGSTLIGQSFTDVHGHLLPEWFQSRPSAATADGPAGYDAAASTGSNLATSNPEQQAAIRDRVAAIERADGVPASAIPSDAVTASGSGLDPHISPAYALLQVGRVAAARDLPVAAVHALVTSRIQGRDLGYLGEPTVNVLDLNLALAEMDR